MDRRFIPVLFAALLGAAPLAAQVRGAVSAPASAGSAHVSAGRGFTGSVHVRGGHPFRHRGGFFPGYWYPYPDYDYYEPAEAEPPAPGVTVVQAPAAAPPEPAAEPLLLEWRGDHFVRVNPADYSLEPGPAPAANSRRDAAARKNAAQPPQELPPAVLVFRDGHKEDVRSYTIIGRLIYTNADYWTQGSWTKKIQIADLDLPSTLKLNQERGSNFSLPSGPNEVMIRP